MKKTGSLIRLLQFLTARGLSGFVFILIILTAAAMSYGFEVQPKTVRSAGNLYERPDISSRVIAELRNGDSVTLVHQDHKWLIVKLTDNRVGWADESLFSDKPDKAVKPAENDSPAPSVPGTGETKAEAASGKNSDGRKLILEASVGHIRETPSPESHVKFTLKKGNTVSLTKTQGDWYLIRLDDGSTGWARGSLFSESPPVPAGTEISSGPEEYPKPSGTEMSSKPAEGPKPAESEISLKPENVESKPQASDADMPKTVKDIRADLRTGGEEKIVMALNGFYPPETFVLEERIPKVVCDFTDTALDKSVKHPVEVKGKFIQRIRVGFHEGPPARLRVVLDLMPDQEYVVERTFFQKENLYILTVKPAGNDKPKSEKQ